MAPLLSPRRTEPTISLKATVPQVPAADRSDQDAIVEPAAGWLVLAVGGALLAALAGWIIVAGLAVVAWLSASPGSLLGALRAGTQLWLLANGGGAQLGDDRLTLVPLGVTLVLGFMIARCAAFAARHANGTAGGIVGRVTAVMTGCYLLVVGAAALLTGRPEQALRGSIGALLIAGLAAAWGSSRGIDFDPTTRLPRWSRALPRAVARAQAVMIVAGCAALTSSVVLEFDRVKALTVGLDTGIVGGVVLVVLQLAFLPNLVLWAASYTLGAGFLLGQGSIVAPRATDLGLLPGIPVLGAVPTEGAGGAGQLGWLAAGVLAGGIAAWTIMRARPAARVDETSLVGGLAGVLAGLAFTGLGWVSSGGLGTGRLAELGPRLLELLVMAVTTMGLSGMLVGLVWGLIRRVRR